MYSENAQEAACESTVATAAPRTPMCRAKIKSGSSRIFKTGADDDGDHAQIGKSLTDDELVQPEREHGEDGSDQVNAHVGFGVGKNAFRRAEPYQQGVLAQIRSDGQADCHADQKHKAVGEDGGSALLILFAGFDGE